MEEYSDPRDQVLSFWLRRTCLHTTIAPFYSTEFSRVRSPCVIRGTSIKRCLPCNSLISLRTAEQARAVSPFINGAQ